MPDILIPNPKKLNQLIETFAHDGKEHFHVIADFDRTLTVAFVNGEPRYAIEKIFQAGMYLGEEFAAISKKNFDKYYPIEVDPTISTEEKKKAMHEWRMVAFGLMIQFWATRDMIKHAMQSDEIVFRQGNGTFFKTLHDNNIPLLIFSASGLGSDAISYCLKKAHDQYDNIGIIANRFVRDENGKAIGIKEPIIHSYNKGETIVKDFPIYEKIQNRKNILLVGDSLGDSHMADGCDYQNIIKIWFLNNDTPENRAQYQARFDIVILNDGPMDEVNAILQRILQ